MKQELLYIECMSNFVCIVPYSYFNAEMFAVIILLELPFVLI